MKLRKGMYVRITNVDSVLGEKYTKRIGQIGKIGSSFIGDPIPESILDIIFSDGINLGFKLKEFEVITKKRNNIILEC